MNGWYRDPTGRFEHRFHNGQVWTADVANGGQRYLDPQPLGAAPSAKPGNGLALAGMVCGITSLAIGWIPFIAVVGIVTAIVGLVLSLVGLARARLTHHGRGFAIAGVVTGALGVVVGVGGIVLTVVLVRLLGEFEDPGPHEGRLTSCTADETGVVAATGVIENLGPEERTYSVLVELRPDADGVIARRTRATVEDVGPGETAEFRADVRIGPRRAASPGCRIVSIDGPLPFGIDPGTVD